MYTVAVSYLEWIRWVATGWFRCADRVVWVEGAEDQQGFDALMNRTPDLQVSDDQGYVIACLKSDAPISSRNSTKERSVGHLWLSVVAVSSFHPLSARGARLLEADAERAAVRLSAPIFEMPWVDWRDRRLEEEAHWRGCSLCAAFGLESPALENLPNRVVDILAGRKAVPNAASVRDGAFEGTRALGWVSAMSVAVIDPAVKAAFKETPEDGKIKALIKSLREDFNLRQQLLNDESIVTIVRDIDDVLRSLGAEALPLELMATVLHYRSLATGERQLSLNALIEDLVAVALGDPSNASLCAYFIGRSMENIAVTTLVYQSDPGRYTALTPAKDQQVLNVMAVAAARLEAKQPVDVVQPASLGNASTTVVHVVEIKPDLTSAVIEDESVEQTVEKLQHAHVDSTAQNEVSPESAIVPPNPSSETKGLAETTNTNSGETGAKEVNVIETVVTPVEVLEQPKQSSTELAADTGQITIEGVEQIPQSNAARKSRKKVGKISGNISGAETSDTK